MHEELKVSNRESLGQESESSLGELAFS